MCDPNLVTTCSFHGQEFLFKMNVLNSNLEILITDKCSGEEWQCSYDATYVENLTHKTGNFKQFDIFVAMIKSGLLRTSESVSLDLLTYDDLEMLRSRKITKLSGLAGNNRRYLIVTYIVEFDKIRYPLPLEYCGPPDPVILQTTIRRLEVELAKTKEELMQKNNNNEAKKLYYLQKRVDELTEDNDHLQEEVRRLSKLLEKKPKTQMSSLQKAVDNLEKSVVSERNSHHDLVEKLRSDKIHLAKELEKIKCSEKSLKFKLSKALSKVGSRMDVGDFNQPVSVKSSNNDLKTVYRKSKSPIGDYVGLKKCHLNLLNKKSSQRFERAEAPRFTKSYISYRNDSRSSSTCSTRYGDAEINQFVAGKPSSIPSRICSRTPSPRAPSRGSSASSRNSSRGSRQSRARRKTVQKLEKDEVTALKKQLNTLQKMFGFPSH